VRSMESKQGTIGERQRIRVGRSMNDFNVCVCVRPVRDQVRLVTAITTAAGTMRKNTADKTSTAEERHGLKSRCSTNSIPESKSW
jgi:hypothetical protein